MSSMDEMTCAISVTIVIKRSARTLVAFKLIAMWDEKTVESSMEMAELENASIHDAQNMGDYVGTVVGFGSQLHLLVDALAMSLDVPFMEDFVLVEALGYEKLKSSAIVPPPTVLERVLKDLCREGPQIISPESGYKSSRIIKGAPLETLFAQLLDDLYYSMLLDYKEEPSSIVFFVDERTEEIG
ncbi:Rab3 GTPase-activating protein catalytic subunit [Tanacetum coccineum]